MPNELVENDFCVYKSGNEVKALGWNINSSLLRNDIPIASYNIQKGGDLNSKTSKGGAIEHLAVPAGLILLRNVIESNTNIININEVKIIGKNLYDRLLELSGEKRKVHKTRNKKIKTRKNKTRKNK